MSELILTFDQDGWAIDENGLYVRSEPDLTLYSTKPSGWLYKLAEEESEPEVWEWPEAWEEPDPYSYWYVERHPERYTWRDDVEKIARKVVDYYSGQVWANTYYDHPEGYWRTETSIDFWDYAGRGYAIDPSLGDEIFNWLFYDPDPPYIQWVIWRATIYGAWNGWYGEPFGYDDFTYHFDHLHVTHV